MKIVALPGLDGTGDFLEPLIDAFGTQHPVIPIKYPPELTQYAELERFVRERLPQDDAFVLLAESFSGPLAVRIAHAPSKGLKGVIFAATFARRPRPLPALAARILNLMPFRKVWFLRLILFLSIRARPKLDFQALFVAAFQKVPAHTFAKRAEQCLRADVRGLLPNLSVPAVFIKATNEYVVSRNAWKDFQAAQIPIIEIKGTHFLMYDQAKCTVAKLQGFLDGLV